MKKDKYLHIFNYLKEFSKIRSNPVRDIEQSDKKYPEKVWLDTIPENKLFENILKSSFDKSNDFWLQIKKPIEPLEPNLPSIQGELNQVVELDLPLSDSSIPRFKSLIELGEDFEESKYEKLKVSFEEFLENDWKSQLDKYLNEYKEYLEAYNRFLPLNEVYKKFFKIYNQVEQSGEEFELIMACGLLNFKENDNSAKIFRHIFTQRVQIDFEYSKNESKLIITPNYDSSIKVETDAIIDLFEQFESQNIIDAEKSVQNYFEDKEIEFLFDGINDSLQMFIEQVSPDGVYSENNSKPKSSSKRPNLSFSPALILRKRDTQSFTALYDEIIKTIDNAGDDIDIPSINDLIGIDDLEGSQDAYESNERPRQIFFPKEYNDEQVEIIEKIERSSKVLVQGPPGTGKSHTIANIICDMLANGKKVLVTSYTKRALEVLKDKLPKEFQDLAVNFLGGDSDSVNDLQSSVNAINEELANGDLHVYRTQIRRLEDSLKKLKSSLAENQNALLETKESTTRVQNFNEKYRGTVSDVAKELEKYSDKFDWYKDSYFEVNDKELFKKLRLFYVGRFRIDNELKKQFENNIPSENHLFDVKSFKNLIKLEKETSTYQRDKLDDLKIQDINSLDKMIETFNSFKNKLDEVNESIKQEYLPIILSSNRPSLERKIDNAFKILNEIKDNGLEEFIKNTEVYFPEGKSLIQLKSDARFLLNFLNEGNSLSGFVFRLKKSFLSNEVKKRLYFVESVKVNGNSCQTIDEFKLVLKEIFFLESFYELKEVFDLNEIEDNKRRLFETYNDFLIELKSLLKIHQLGTKFKEQFEVFCNLIIDPFDFENVDKALELIKQKVILSELWDLQKKSQKTLEYLSFNTFHPIADDLKESINSRNDFEYERLLFKLNELYEKKQEVDEFLELESYIKALLPDLYNQILDNQISTEQVDDFESCLMYWDTKFKINKILNEDRESHLNKEISRLDRSIQNVIGELGAKKSWYSLISEIQENRQLRQHLEAWVMAVKKIGKTGKGKRAAKFKRVAQKEMDYCKDSVPCWIMPMYKVAETISPKQGMYDCVIIDEASQLGPDAIFLVYLAKKIIIVGDDKQTSPEYIGVDANSMMPFINKYLSEIPFKDFYGTEFSFFDHAKFFCDGMTVLREHFRCMPEIIEFSNKYFYKPDSKSLFPLKQYSENRLAPLKTCFVNNGYVEGKASRIINEPEAELIADKIAEICILDEYKNKTIGVITLQGNQQSNIIENLVVERIGEKEYFERKIICGNSSSFQGDERDIIFLSLVTAQNHNRSALTRPEDERRFNVAMSRAKEQVWLFHSIQIEDLSNTNDLRYKLLDHFLNFSFDKPVFKSVIKDKSSIPEPFDSMFEVDVFNELVSKGYQIIPQYEVANGRYRIDLVAILDNGTKIAIECDGDKWHGPEQFQNDMMRQKVLERCGWQFFRIRGYEYYSRKDVVLDSLFKVLDEGGLNQKETKIEETGFLVEENLEKKR